jgi:hypothetical protein
MEREPRDRGDQRGDQDQPKDEPAPVHAALLQVIA